MSAKERKPEGYLASGICVNDAFAKAYDVHAVNYVHFYIFPIENTIVRLSFD